MLVYNRFNLTRLKIYIMIRSPHLLASIITAILLVLFLVLKPILGFQFGFRTYWPVFVCLYLIVWYFSVSPTKNRKINNS